MGPSSAPYRPCFQDQTQHHLGSSPVHGHDSEPELPQTSVSGLCHCHYLYSPYHFLFVCFTNFYQNFCLFVFFSEELFVFLFVCLSVCLSVYLLVFWSVCFLFATLFSLFVFWLFVCLYVCLLFAMHVCIEFPPFHIVNLCTSCVYLMKGKFNSVHLNLVNPLCVEGRGIQQWLPLK